jgi:hypothetical protein
MDALYPLILAALYLVTVGLARVLDGLCRPS